MHEAADGAATLDWVAGLPFSTGKIGTYGFSYQGATQYLALAGGGKRPDAMAPVMAPWSIRNDWAFEGNAFRNGSNVGWAAQMGWLEATRRGDFAAAAELRHDANTDRLSAFLLARPELSQLGKWRADDPAYWASLSPDQLLQGDALDVPVLHIGGWCDYMLGGTFAADAAFRARHPDSSHLVVGPWTHLPWNRSAGAADMGPAAEYSIDRAQLRFFDLYLKQKGVRPDAVELFDVGQRQWRRFDGLPALARKALHLHSDGLAATLLTDGRLEAEPGQGGIDRLVHDPSNPAPLIGGHHGTPAGFVNRARADDRADVAVYSTAPFERETLLCGEVVLHLSCGASFAPFDVVASLSVVSPSGETIVLCTGVRRNDTAAVAALELSLPAVCVTLAAGQALRLSLQGAAAPMFAVPRRACRPRRNRARSPSAFTTAVSIRRGSTCRSIAVPR